MTEGVQPKRAYRQRQSKNTLVFEGAADESMRMLRRTSGSRMDTQSNVEPCSMGCSEDLDDDETMQQMNSSGLITN